MNLLELKISDEQKSKAELEVTSGTELVNQLSAFENYLRNEKYKETADAFGKIVLGTAAFEEENAQNEIVGCMLKSFGENIQSGELSQNSREYVLKYAASLCRPDGYETLIIRFTQDLLEVMIHQPFMSQERFDRFSKTEQNFYTLAVFFDAVDKQTNIQNNPLIQSLLFQQYKISEYNGNITSLFDNIKDKVSKITKLTDIGDIAEPLLEFSAKAFLSGLAADAALAMIDTAFDGFEDMLDSNSRRHEAMDCVKGLRLDGGDTRTLEEKYKERGNAYNGIRRDYGTITDVINRDIDCLCDILQTVLPKVIQLEKPFAARVVNVIESLINSVDSGAYSEFFSDNLPLIDYEEQRKLDAKAAEAAMWANILTAVEDCVGGLNL
ncbi:hypothetical protein AGMMS49975_11040 [Clostridia bacterium]|nr:hypothetical protein AGMMS49975_11040 [Clostridia bacterium]